MTQNDQGHSKSGYNQRVKSRYLIFICMACLGITLNYSISSADWVNLTGSENARNIAEIYVNEDHVKIRLEIFIEDMALFKELIPDDMFPGLVPGHPGVEKRTKNISEQTFQVITDTGENLTAELSLLEPRLRVKRPSFFVGLINPYTRQRIPGPPDDKRVLYAELTYPFSGKPDYLTFIPPVNEKGFSTASIGFVCYHLGVPVVDFRHLTQKSTLNLKWDDPWYSAFQKSQLKRNLQTGVRTYLYIEDYEVRHEILVRVKDMMTWMDFDLRSDEFIEEDEFDPVRSQVARFFMERERVLIDGQQLKPILDRTAYVESSMIRSRFIEIPERVPLNTAMIGIVITYLTDGIPGKVVTQWDLFSDRVQKVTASMTDPAGPFPYDLTPDDNVLTWTNHLKTYTIPTVDNVAVNESHRGIAVPILSLFCSLLLLPLGVIIFQRHRKSQSVKIHTSIFAALIVGAITLLPYSNTSVGSTVRESQISDEDCKRITTSLLRNVYRAFDFREEEDVYDKLATSVSGALLEDVYLQSRKSLLIEEAGGAQAKVKGIEVLEAEVQASSEQRHVMTVRANWITAGSVGHWGHIHNRQNYYEALLRLQIVNGSWKIAEIELLEEKRLDPDGQKLPEKG